MIGEVDFVSALTTVHEKAIYIHGGQQYHVEHLDFKERKAYVKQVDVDYYTDAIRYTQVRVLEIAAATASSRQESAVILRSSQEPAILSEAKDLIRRHPHTPNREHAFPWRRPGPLPGCRLQEDQVLHQRKRGRRHSRAS